MEQIAFDFGTAQVAANDSQYEPVAAFVARERQGDAFYVSPEWKSVRREALQRGHYRCANSGCPWRERPRLRGRLEVDHIIPRSVNRELELVLSNLQVLCADCHQQKSYQDAIRWGWKRWA